MEAVGQGRHAPGEEARRRAAEISRRGVPPAPFDALLPWSEEKRARVEKEQRQEQSALNDAGANSYLGYVVGRVNTMMDDTDNRRRRLAVGEDHRAAAVPGPDHDLIGRLARAEAARPAAGLDCWPVMTSNLATP